MVVWNQNIEMIKKCTQKLYTTTCDTTTVGCEHLNSQLVASRTSKDITLEEKRGKKYLNKNFALSLN